MAKQRPSRLSPTGLQEAPERARPRRWPIVVIAVLAAGLALAWMDGGEEPLHPIAQDVSLSEQGQ